MNKPDLKKFHKLKDSEKLLCLDWFGAVLPNLQEPDNPLLECYFTPITLENNKGDEYFSRKYYFQICIEISIGFLPYLYIGQIYKNGIHHPILEDGKTKKIEFGLDTTINNSIVETTVFNANLDEKSKLINPRFESAKNMAGAKILKSNNPLLKTKALIHEIELIRFYLTNSAYLCKKVFSNDFQSQNIYSQIINATDEQPFLDSETQSARFVYRFGFRKMDAPILGRIIFEPNGRALAAVRRVHNRITVDRINQSNLNGYPRTNFPFSQKTTLKLIGRKILTNEADGGYFLVHQILGCSASFPFKELSYCCEVSPGGQPAPENSPAAFPGANTLYRGPANDDKSGDSKSDEPPLSGSDKLITELAAREFGGLKDVKLTHEKRKDCTHTSHNKNREYLDYLTNASTGAGKHSKSNAVGQEFDVPLVTPPEISIDLELFIDVINAIKLGNKSWKFKTIQVGNGFTKNEEAYSFFPDVLCDIRYEFRQFSYMDKEKNVPRQFVCVELNIDNQYLYLFEAQRRLKGNNSKEEKDYKEKLPILLVHANEFQQLISSDFSELLEQTVRKRTWDIPNSKHETLKRDRSLHSLSKNAKDDMKRRILELIQRNLSF